MPPPTLGAPPSTGQRKPCLRINHSISKPVRHEPTRNFGCNRFASSPHSFVVRLFFGLSHQRDRPVVCSSQRTCGRIYVSD